MTVRRAMVGLVLATGWMGWAPRAEEPARDPVIRLGELLIEGTVTDRDLLATPTLESAALEIATSVVDAETIRLQGSATLVDALDFAPGIWVEERGRKEKQLVSFRGQVYPYPDFALNGVWQRSFYEVPSFLPAAAIERVEILRSGGAIMVGPNSGLVGAVNVVPRRFDEPTTLFAGEFGSHGTFRESVVHGDRTDRGYYTLGLSRSSTDGPDDENAAERFTTLFGTGGFDASDSVHLELTGFYLDGQRELRLIQAPGQNALMNRYEQFDPYRSYGLIGRALVEHDDQGSTEIDLGYARRVGDYERQDRSGFNAHEVDWEYNLGILHAQQLTEDNTLRLGLQYNHWICPDGKRFFVGKRMDVETYSVVVADEQRFDRLTLDAGIRSTFTWYEDYTDTTFAVDGARLSSRPIADDWGDPGLITTLGAKYQLTDPLALYGHLAVGTIDAPSGAATAAGDDIGREMRLIMDGGIRAEKAGLGRVQVGVFTVLRDSAILLTQTQVTVDGELVNVYGNSDVRQYGLELEVRSTPIREICTAYTTATLMNSTRDDGNGWIDYREIPDTVLTAGLHVAVERVDLNLFGKCVSGYENKRFAQDGQYHDLGDFVDLNLTVGIRLGREERSRLTLSVQNLLNDRYSTVVGFPDYGTQVFVGFEHRL